MKEKILEIINAKPKHYVSIIKNTPELYKWVKEESIIKNDKLVEMIYSSIYKISNICENGNIKKFDRISTGFIGCGPANKCECTKKSISKNVSIIKSNYTENKNSEINEKRAKTMLSKYGSEYNSQRLEVKKVLSKPKITINSYNKLINYEWLNNEYNIKQRSLVDIAEELNVYYSTVAEYCKKFNFKIRQTSNYSLCEKEVSNFLKNLNINFIEHDWDILQNQEIDILIPSKNLGIEINGLYWHSYHPESIHTEDRDKHFYKTEKAKEKNYEIIHITDYEWKNKNNIIKNIIKSKLNLNSKIYARNCIVKIVSKNEEKIFLNNYHLQGYISSYICYGLYLQDELLMIISLGKSRYDKKYDFEILRICSTNGITVVGGVSKLMTHIKNNHKNKKIITYCDIDKSSGNSYFKSGFKFIGKTSPGYIWTDGNNIISRYKTQKKQLKKWLKNYDENLSESKNMFNQKYRRFWNCGNYIFEYQT